jgi:hypothetical protein
MKKKLFALAAAGVLALTILVPRLEAATWTVANGWLRVQLERAFDLDTTPTATGNPLVYNATTNKFAPGTSIVVSDGSAAAPTVGFSTSSNGIYSTTGEVAVSIGGSRLHRFGSAFVQVASDSGRFTLGAADGDTSITRAAAGELTYTAVLFANLGTPANGTQAYCSDCTFANPCAGAGTGAIAKRLNGAWRCD